MALLREQKKQARIPESAPRKTVKEKAAPKDDERKMRERASQEYDRSAHLFTTPVSREKYIQNYILRSQGRLPKREDAPRAANARKTGNGSAGHRPAQKLRVADLEHGMPVVEDALARMRLELDTARSLGARAVKLIHGYGSSGRGGAIKKAVHLKLAEMKRNGQIADFVPGENFDPTDERARRLLEKLPDMKNDRDYARGNDGITLVVLK